MADQLLSLHRSVVVNNSLKVIYANFILEMQLL